MVGSSVSTTQMVTLIIDHGNRSHIAVPSGVSLSDVLQAMQIRTDLVPYRLDGTPVDVRARVGSTIASGSLIILRERGWSVTAPVTQVPHSASRLRSRHSFLVSLLAILAGTLVAAWAFHAKVTGSWPAETWIMVTLLGACSLIAVVLALLPSHGRPLTEMAGPALVGVAAAIIGTWPNLGAWAHQAVATAALAVALLAMIRVTGPGKEKPGPTNVGVDLAVISMIIGLATVWFMFKDLPIWFLATILFGLAPAILKASPGLTIRVTSDVLLDNESVIREAPAVRHREHIEAEPDVAAIVVGSRSRFRLWVCLTSVWLVVGAPSLITIGEGWQGTVASVALALGVAAFLLLPRTSTDPVARIVPRLAAAIVATMIMVSSGAPPIWIPVILAVAGIGLGAGSLLITEDRQFYLLSRIGDIVQGFAVVWALPLSLVGAGVISLVRTGSL